MSTLSTSLNVRLSATYQKAIDLINEGLTAPLSINVTKSMETGTGADLADKAWWNTSTLAASASETWDLDALTDAFGDVLTFVKVKLLYVKASDDNNAANPVVVGGGDFAGPFADASDKVNLSAGDVFLATKFGSGWTVTATSADGLLVTNGAGTNSVTYDIVLIGTSA